MKVNLFNLSKKNSTSNKKNIRICSNILDNLIKDKENFFLSTLSENYQKNIFLKKIILKKKLNTNILIVGMGGSIL